MQALNTTNATDDGIELLPAALRAALPPLYGQEHAADPTVHVRLFTPWSSWTWYVTEGGEDGGYFLLSGLCVGHEREWGYSSFAELEALRGPGGLRVERDAYFTARPALTVIGV
jgi:hypothetical protein